jgi:hypothetical protein
MGNPIAHSSVMIRREILLKHDLFYNNEFRTSQDYDLWCRLVSVTKFYRLDEAYLYYRKATDSVFHSNINSSLNNALLSNKLMYEKITGAPPGFL